MLRIEIDTNGAAFTDSQNSEIARILQGIANNFENGATEPCHGKLRDSNGNTCGSYEFDLT